MVVGFSRLAAVLQWLPNIYIELQCVRLHIAFYGGAFFSRLAIHRVGVLRIHAV